MKTTFSALLLLFSLLTCVEDTRELTFSEETITTPKNDIVEINIPKAKGNDTVSKKINSKIHSLIRQALIIGDPDKSSGTLETQIDSFNIEYQNFKKEFPNPPMVWDAQIDGEVTYQSSDIITIAITIYTFTGGAHGISTVTFLNFDTTTGNTISNEALFNNLEAFNNLAKSYLMKEAEGKEDAFFSLDTFVPPSNIGFSDDGLILLYNVYEIAPYSTGLIEFNIPFEEMEAYLNYH